uniref:Uncharacterized protein n=1 Tax=Octopus bimaculoides TaxID=37653 RepID=A0A0L8FPX6_OCTBM
MLYYKSNIMLVDNNRYYIGSISNIFKCSYTMHRHSFNNRILGKAILLAEWVGQKSPMVLEI